MFGHLYCVLSFFALLVFKLLWTLSALLNFETQNLLAIQLVEVGSFYNDKPAESMKGGGKRKGSLSIFTQNEQIATPSEFLQTFTGLCERPVYDVC